MPQMAPMMWLNLFMFFIMVFMMFNVMNYFSMIYKNKSLNFFLKKTLIIWKW
uniref:ATP synthase complex subunit 8 n=2 Tax=Lampyridae TaxID=7049 RepID=A0A5C0PWW0_9COLE|nr:ATP synthase F0 subunit 8 [Vesta saturnalis]QEJ81568.1 ATP synthase F0 subunit 8 [Vesta saturnalis]QRG30032.1 ATP synthase F0 subunit 8 [Emeia pseudosauteri]